MPGQQGSWRDQPAAAQPGRKQPGKRRQDRAVGPVQPRPGHLAAQHHHFVTQHMISAFFDAWPRPSRTSQPDIRTMIRYSRRTDTNRDHAPTRRPRQIAGHRPCTEFLKRYSHHRHQPRPRHQIRVIKRRVNLRQIVQQSHLRGVLSAGNVAASATPIVPAQRAPFASTRPQEPLFTRWLCVPSRGSA